MTARIFYDQGLSDEATPRLDLGDGRIVPDHAVMLALLLAEGVILISGEDATLHVICSDTFAYACADCEPITRHRDIVELFEMWEANPEWCATRWCILRRGARPIAPIVEMMKRDGVWDAELEARASEASR